MAPITYEHISKVVEKYNQEHPPVPLPPEVERDLVKVWGPMKMTKRKRGKAA